LGILKIEDPRISRQSAHECSNVFSPKHQPLLLYRRYRWYSFLLAADSTPNNPIENRTRDLPACSTVPQPPLPPRTPSPPPSQCIYVFCVYLRTNSDYLPVQH